MSTEDFQSLRNKNKKSQNQGELSFYLSKLEISTPSDQQKHPIYQLTIQTQDKKGKITTEITVSRTLTQLIGFAKSISKREKENDLGRSAQQLQELLVNSLNDKRNHNVQRISIQHFLNEVLRSGIIMGSSECKAFFEYGRIKGECCERQSVESESKYQTRRSVVVNDAQDEKSSRIDYRELQKQLGIK